MTLIDVKNLSYSTATKVLFEEASFVIDEVDKVAIIGPNGCGKTTLLHEIAQINFTENKHISSRKGLSISYLPQSENYNPEHTIVEHLFQSENEASKAIKKYQTCLKKYEKEQTPETERLLNNATELMSQVNAWDYESHVSSILRELEIDDLNQKMSDLSGGMRKKVSLAQVFFETCDVLILDEPTNHLDIKTIEWLEMMLKRQNVALLMVTHDRYFLDKICNKIIEIDQKKVYVYNGNYQSYLIQRDERYRAAENKENAIQSVLRVELEWLKRGPKARSTKQEARKKRIDDMMNRNVYSPENVLSLQVADKRLGKKIVDLKAVSKSFGEKSVIKSFSYSFIRGEKIGILGPNGSGKTTLLNLITGKMNADAGVVDVGINTSFAFFDQHSEVFDPTQTIHEHVSEIGSQLVLHDGRTVSAAKLLEQFLFPSQMLKTPIAKLSGGEKRRLHLVCLLLKNPNFLVLDEPTNDLDIQTLSVLEDFLLSFSGCVLIVSHDRYFMDRVVDQLLVLNSNFGIQRFQGNYTDYMDTLADIEFAKKRLAKDKKTTLIQPQKIALNNEDKKKSQRLEKEIEALEKEKSDVNQTFNQETMTKKDYEDLGKRLKKIEDQIEEKFKAWSLLN